MSPRNETLASEFADAFNARDFDGLVGRAHHHCVIVALRSEKEGPYLGREGVRRWAVTLVEAVPTARFSLERVEAAGPESVLLIGRQSGDKNAPGPAFDAPLAAVAVFEGTLLAELTAYATADEAILAAGLKAD